MKDYKLKFTPLDAPPIIVPTLTVEVYLAVSSEQADRLKIRREIEPMLPDGYYHPVYSAVFDLPKEWEVKGGITWEWKIPKDRIEEVMEKLYPDGTDYPYMQALDMIEGDYFYLMAWDD